MEKQLRLIDINDYIDDNQQVKLVAYGITIYEGDALHIPAGYVKYPLDPTEKRIYSENDVLIITMDC